MAGLWAKSDATPEGKYPIVLRRDGSVVEHPYFLLMARDPVAPIAIRAYADAAEKLNWDPYFIRDLRALATEYEEYRKKFGDGDPDAPKHRKDDPQTIAWARATRTRSA